MLGNGGGRQLQKFGDLADAQRAAGQGHESADAAFVCQGIGDGKHVTHEFTPMVISPDNEMYLGILPIVKRVLGTGP
jgi:hypothetical protein